MDLPRDRGLRARMAAALVLAVAVAVALAAVAVVLLVAIWQLGVAVASAVASMTGASAVAVLRIGGLALVLGVLGRLVLAAVGDDGPTWPRESYEPPEPDVPPTLDRVATTVAAQFDLPPPDVAVVDSRVPTAYTAGRSSATVTVTTALLDRLGDDELEAVVAHELAHVHNRDALVVAVASAPARVAWWLQARADDRWAALASENSGNAALGTVAVLTFAVAGFVGLLGRVAVSSLSRYRELAADRAAVAATGSPGDLAAALRVAYDAPDRRDLDLRETRGIPRVRSIAPMDDPGRGSWLAYLGHYPRCLRTHPSLDSRLAHLRDIERHVETR